VTPEPPDPILTYWNLLEADYAHYYPTTDLATISWRKFVALTAALYHREDSAWANAQRIASEDNPLQQRRQAGNLITDPVKARAYLATVWAGSKQVEAVNK